MSRCDCVDFGLSGFGEIGFRVFWHSRPNKDFLSLYLSIASLRVGNELKGGFLVFLLGDCHRVVDINAEGFAERMFDDGAEKFRLSTTLKETITEEITGNTEVDKVVLEGRDGGALKLFSGQTTKENVDERLLLARDLVFVLVDSRNVNGGLCEKEDATDGLSDALVVVDVVCKQNLFSSVRLDQSLELKVFPAVDVISCERSRHTQPPSVFFVRIGVVSGDLDLPKVTTKSKTKKETLNAIGIRLDFAFAHFLERKDGLRGTNKDLCLAISHGLCLEMKGIKNLGAARLKVSVPSRPRCITTDPETIKELVVKLTKGKSCSTHSNVLQETEITDLMLHEIVLKVSSLLLLVGFDASDVMRMAFGECVDEGLNRCLDLEACCCGTLFVCH